ncbi:M14 family metallopeptidase [Luteimonas sp. MC1825]|uniref:M14 family metallopeptidase n=1 Tax=Luteimonas sp. MC1825 TaxID=2761107 RepID=UPI0016221DC2|nr:M14 family metallopeptidase [Luteimonas sp. MC1825]MBB6598981.1 M14 family metallopeptidase [Luteimonas sp. MC1825]QOC89119.1 M14 family metallopeptidase [Luteimonas sp. MC1825]
MPSPVRRLPLLLALLLLPCTLPALASGAGNEVPAATLLTESERSGFVRTGRYDEVPALCEAFAARWPEAVRCGDFGTTPEGRPMKVLVASRSGALTPAAARAARLPVLLVQGGIHAGEIDGKDAGFLALREVLEGTAAPGALERQVLVFVPVFNVDGHERFGAWNRPNQRGPEQMGWRTTAQNFNLNRDYLKADSAEMQAMLRLLAEWDPIATVDLHATNGAQFEHDISVQVEPLHSGDAGLRAAGLDLRTGLLAALTASGSLPLPFYPSFIEDDNPDSGIADGVPPPRFSHGYFPLRNRFGILVETHSWKSYPVRVRITRNLVVAMLERTARDGARWLRLATHADAAATGLGGTTLALDYRASDRVRHVDFRGYAWTRTPSDISGALMTRYDESVPQTWSMPLRDEVLPGRTIVVPRGGYLVPSRHAARVAAALRLHGVEFRTLDSARQAMPVHVFRADTANFAATSSEGHQRLELTGHWQPETRELAAGALFVPIAQARARMAVALLEPQAPDSLAAWGVFNNAFERKEYMEAYVAEDVARGMLVDPAVKAAFEALLRDDAAFAGSPQARLEFFHRRHPSWDERHALYPVFRIDQAP